MSDDQPTISALERCLESLAFCHVQDEPRWAAARIVAQQDIDEFMRSAGPVLADQHQALSLLMAEFARRFPGEADPVLIRSTMRRQMRRVGYDIKRADDRPQEEDTPSGISSPATAPEDADGDIDNRDVESERSVTQQQGDA